MAFGYNNSPYKGITFSVYGAIGGTGAGIVGDWGATLGQWHHIVGRWTSDGFADLWLDGAQIATNAAPNTADGGIDFDYNQIIGAWYNVGGRGIDGKLANIQFWDAFWDEASIVKASQSPHVTPSQINETGLKVWYPCTKDDEFQSLDQNNHTLTVSGGVTQGDR